MKTFPLQISSLCVALIIGATNASAQQCINPPFQLDGIGTREISVSFPEPNGGVSLSVEFLAAPSISIDQPDDQQGLVISFPAAAGPSILVDPTFTIVVCNGQVVPATMDPLPGSTRGYSLKLPRGGKIIVTRLPASQRGPKLKATIIGTGATISAAGRVLRESSQGGH